MRRVAFALLLFAAFAPCALRAADAPTLALRGLDGERAELTLEELAALPREKVEVDQHGVHHVYEGPLLGDLLAKVGAPRGKDIRGPHMADVVLAEAKDGYKIALDLAGTDAATRSERVIVALAMDGAPLGEEAGPLRLVVEGDLRPARAARSLTTITLVRLR